MNRRAFIESAASALVMGGALATASDTTDVKLPRVDVKGPYSIEIVSPPERAGRELPIFDSYKQAENFAQARMNLLRQDARYDMGGSIPAHEAGQIKIWTADNQLVYECSWGETWTMAYSYVDVDGRLS
jgi:hypothetical protein